ncbi:hypothetical protein [Nostoc sp. CALU 1950]|uniref:hypothetical protein n=1 Tax=Nostoc sp. CALU 1950 TaxID=3104321 RepID=UPI003EBB0023
MGLRKKLPMPNAQCPKRRGDYPSIPTRGWSFPPLSMNVRSLNSDLQHQNSTNWLQNHKKMQILCMLCD